MKRGERRSPRLHEGTEHRVDAGLDNAAIAWHIGTMRQVLGDIEAGKLSDELKRRGIPAHQRLRVVVETVGEEDIPITRINEAGGAFDWLAEEPDLYSDADLVERYRE